MTTPARPAPGSADFRALFEAELGFVYRTLRRHGASEADLPDLCQEVFLVVHRRLSTFEGRSSLRTWLYGIALRVASGHRRKARHRYESARDELPDPGVEPTQLEGADQRQMLVLVEQALQATTPERREAFTLYELEGMTMAQVAAALSVPESTVYHRFQRARDDIRAHVERHTRPPPRVSSGGG